jgi:hypothetical protein
MKNSANNSIIAKFALHFVGLSLCVVPAAVCTLMYFPLWKEDGYASCIAGGTALLLAICALPIFKLISQKLTSVSSYMIWLMVFLLFFAMSKIAEQMTVISFVGFVSNLVGGIFIAAARRKGAVEK